MDQMTFDQIAKSLTLHTSEGLHYEFNHSLGKMNNVFDFSVEVEGDVYVIAVRLRDHSISEAKKVFHAVLEFVEYSGGSVYIREMTDEGLHYECISFDTDHTGFYFELHFLNV